MRERRFTQLLVCITVVVLHYNYLRYDGKCQYDAGSAPVGSSNTASSGPGSKPSIYTDYTEYVPAPCEEILVSQSEALGWKSVGEEEERPRTCRIWDDPKLIDCGLDGYAVDLDGYVAAVQQFVPIADVHEPIKKLGNYSVCGDAKLHKSGLGGMFPSGQLSLTSSGYVEPLVGRCSSGCAEPI